MRVGRRLAAGVLGPVLTVVALSACQPKAGEAAFVNGQGISDGTLRGMVQRGIATAGVDPHGAAALQVQDQALRLLILSQLIRVEATRHGVSTQLTPNDLQRGQQSYAQSQGEPVQAVPDDLASNGVAPQDQNVVFGFQALMDRFDRAGIDGQRLIDELRSINVSVNPRFGAWDANRLAVVAAKDDLSQPAPSNPVLPLGG